MILFYFFLIIFILNTYLVMIHFFDSFDKVCLLVLPSSNNETLLFLMHIFSLLGGNTFLCFISVFLFFFLYQKGDRESLIGLVLVLIITATVGPTIKNYVGRSRPDFIIPLGEFRGWAYPSGHSFNSFLIFSYLYYSLKQHMAKKCQQHFLGIVVTLIIFLVGLSRYYLRVHYPSDIWGGFLLGGTAFLGVLKLRSVIYLKLKSNKL